MPDNPADGADGGDRRDRVNDMQDLLRLSIRHGPAEGQPAAAGELDAERRQFLAAAMAQAAGGTAETLRAVLAALAEPDAARQLNALRLLREHVDNIDIANEFEKMAGLEALRGALNSDDGEIRATAAGAVADMVQNNPQCQRSPAALELLPVLLQQVQQDSDPTARVTALQAVSGLLRDNPAGQTAFCGGDGCAALVSAMQSGQPRLQTKAAFLLGSVCAGSAELRATALQVGLVEQVAGLLAEPHQSWHEHLLAALETLAADGEAAAAECRRPQLQLAELLQLREQQLAGREEELETLEHCRRLRQLCFSGEEVER